MRAAPCGASDTDLPRLTGWRSLYNDDLLPLAPSVVEQRHRLAGSISGWQLAPHKILRLREKELTVCVHRVDQDPSFHLRLRR